MPKETLAHSGLLAPPRSSRGHSAAIHQSPQRTRPAVLKPLRRRNPDPLLFLAFSVSFSRFAIFLALLCVFSLLLQGCWGLGIPCFFRGFPALSCTKTKDQIGRVRENAANYHAIVFSLRPPHLLRLGPFLEGRFPWRTQEDGIRTGGVTKVFHCAIVNSLPVAHLRPQESFKAILRRWP